MMYIKVNPGTSVSSAFLILSLSVWGSTTSVLREESTGKAAICWLVLVTAAEGDLCEQDEAEGVLLHWGLKQLP